MGYKVKLNIFEGPFDLLVYLIESARMSIYDIKVSEITEQYMRYISEMEQMDVELSSEFMVLAAQLIEIKSKMLLPRAGTDGEETLGDDPRTELMERLLEYKKFKNISEMLAAGERRAARIYEKPQEDISRYTDEPDEYLKLGINEFVNAFDLFLEKKKKLAEIRERYVRIERQKISAETKMDQIRGLFETDRNRALPFDELVADKKDRYDIALSFSSLLEMIRQQRLTAEQQALFGEILVKATDKLDEEPRTEENGEQEKTDTEGETA